MNETFELQKELLTLSNKKLGIEKIRESATPEQLIKLKRLGFSNHWLNVEKNIVKFPLLKILHKGAIKEICKKYNLIYGPAEKFIGRIPKKNADEIIRNSDYIKKVLGREIKVIEDENGRIWEDYEVSNNYGHRRLSRLIRDKELIIKKRNKHFKFAPRIVEPELDIRVIAPPEEFDKKGYKVKGHKLKVKDPIVLAKIDDKLLVVLSAWGPESLDANIFNEQNN